MDMDKDSSNFTSYSISQQLTEPLKGVPEKDIIFNKEVSEILNLMFLRAKKGQFRQISFKSGKSLRNYKEYFDFDKNFDLLQLEMARNEMLVHAKVLQLRLEGISSIRKIIDKIHIHDEWLGNESTKQMLLVNEALKNLGFLVKKYAEALKTQFQHFQDAFSKYQEFRNNSDDKLFTFISQFFIRAICMDSNKPKNYRNAPLPLQS